MEGEKYSLPPSINNNNNNNDMKKTQIDSIAKSISKLTGATYQSNLFVDLHAGEQYKSGLSLFFKAKDSMPNSEQLLKIQVFITKEIKVGCTILAKKSKDSARVFAILIFLN